MGLLDNIESLITTENNICIGEFSFSSPDNSCSINIIPGRPSQHVLGQQAALFRNPSIQINVRDTSLENGYSRCEAIIALLDGVSTPQIMSCMLESDIINLGKDDKNRSTFMMIYRLRIY